ncbi:MAG TPA: prolyl oligopeptidase family serine peptidase [Sphingomonadaceae bacterium]|nr:prolyl oligopeptidase family serine peptidase [Sphingomonadaceae bacterium]
MTPGVAQEPAAAPGRTASLVYPETERGNVVEAQFGVPVADPYRWLENDVRTDPKVAEWVARQNAVTGAYLATLPARETFEQRLRTLYDYERFGVPRKAGNRYFYSRNSGLQNQAVLFVRDGLSGAPRMLIDPNTWAQDGATALAEWEPSDDGRYLVYGVQDGGTDWRTVRVLDVASGRVLPDEIKWVKFSGLEWAKDGSGFYYSRFPAPDAKQQFQSLNENQAIYFHRIGTPQSADRLVFARPDRPKLSNGGTVSDDGRWLVVTSSEGTDDRYDITLIDLTKPGSAPRPYVTGLQNNWSYIGNQGDTFYWVTNKGAPRLKIVATDINRSPDQAREIVPEDAATLGDASIVGRQLIASYLVDAKTEVRTFDLTGKRTGVVKLPGIGTAGGFSGDADDSETFYAFSSFNMPTTIYRYDSASGQTSVFAQPKVAFSPADFVVSQRFYRSKDGTRVPMFVVHKKGLDTRRPQPTLLYAYGGFNVPSLPGFSATRLAWMEQGGVFALANIRGGGEYGKAWHDAGRLANKQNVFDDFIGAGEYLIKEGITSKDKLAIQGGSNGGLLVGAVVNQRPDLFAAALPAVGVMDMLRFDRFTAGRYWVDDYGYPNREPDFRNLLAYSPYHNIKGGRNYPAVLVTTADTDDRVVPGHSFKYAAALQAAANTGGAPKLIRIETRAGHGSGKPTDKIIEEYADLWAFVAHHTGLKVGGARTAGR